MTTPLTNCINLTYKLTPTTGGVDLQYNPVGGAPETAWVTAPSVLENYVQESSISTVFVFFSNFSATEYGVKFEWSKIHANLDFAGPLGHGFSCDQSSTMSVTNQIELTAVQQGCKISSASGCTLTVNGNPVQAPYTLEVKVSVLVTSTAGGASVGFDAMPQGLALRMKGEGDFSIDTSGFVTGFIGGGPSESGFESWIDVPTTVGDSRELKFQIVDAQGTVLHDPTFLVKSGRPPT